MKNSKQKTALYVSSILFSILSSALGYGFMSGLDISFNVKFICGFIFIATPVLVIQLILLNLGKR